MASQSDGFESMSLKERIFLSAAALATERFARAFWPCWTLAALGLAVALSGFLPRFGGLLHSVVLAVFGVAMAVALLQGIRRWRFPNRREARARLDAGVPERPASTLADRQIIGTADPFSVHVWRMHKARAAAAAKELDVAGPNVALATRDPWALRAAAILLLLAGGIHAGADWRLRLGEAIIPEFSEGAGVALLPPEFEAWVEPPAYTGVPPIYLTERPLNAKRIELPIGTVFEARVYGASQVPVVRSGSLDGPQETENPLAAVGDGAYSLSLPLSADGRIQLELGESQMGTWEIGITPDLPPTIEFSTPPQRTQAGALTFSYRVSDDYGAVRAWAIIAPERDTSARPRLIDLESIEIPLALPLAFVGESEEFVIRDLTAHPWAGSEVLAVLYVEDDIEQLGQSQVYRFVLPTRDFEEPMAKALVEQRRNLAFAASVNEAGYSHATLTAALRHPDDYFDDPVAYLASRVGVERLAGMIWQDSSWASMHEVLELLWRAARRLEDGTLGDATEQLRNAIRALEDALARDATDAELAQLMQALRQAINEYLMAMRDHALENPDTQLSEAPVMDSNALNEMLDSLEGNARVGQREQARRMLAGLRSMLENLRVGSGQGMSGLNELGELVEDQIGLADDTLQTGRAMEQSSDGSLSEDVLDPDALAAMQDELRQRLDELRQQMLGGGQSESPAPGGQPMPGAGAQPGEGAGAQGGTGQGGPPVPGDEVHPGLGGPAAARRSLDRAGSAMGQAQQQLEGGNPGGALESQLEAAEAMRAAGRQLSSGDQGEAVGVMPGQGQGMRDPFGRFEGNGSPIGDLAVPDTGGLQRVKELFDEIRQRAGERTRPEVERDYLERLIDRF